MVTPAPRVSANLDKCDEDRDVSAHRPGLALEESESHSQCRGGTQHKGTGKATPTSDRAGGIMRDALGSLRWPLWSQQTLAL